MNTLNTASESSSKVTQLMNVFNTACEELFEAFDMTFDKVREYGMKTVKGVFDGVKSLFADVIVMKLNQVATLVRELRTEGKKQGFQPAYINSLIDLQNSQMNIKMERHNFFKQNFQRKVNETFA